VRGRRRHEDDKAGCNELENRVFHFLPPQYSLLAKHSVGKKVHRGTHRVCSTVRILPADYGVLDSAIGQMSHVCGQAHRNGAMIISKTAYENRALSEIGIDSALIPNFTLFN
jgi:hypothetical protein